MGPFISFHSSYPQVQSYISGFLQACFIRTFSVALSPFSEIGLVIRSFSRYELDNQRIKLSDSESTWKIASIHAFLWCFRSFDFFRNVPWRCNLEFSLKNESFQNITKGHESTLFFTLIPNLIVLNDGCLICNEKNCELRAQFQKMRSKLLKKL